MRTLASAAERTSSGTPWGRILSTGAVAGVFTLLLQRLIIFLYVYGYVFFTGESPEQGRLDLFAASVALWGTPALHVLLALLAAFWVARGARAAPVLYGISVGAASAASNQLIIFVLFPPMLPAELAQYLFLGAAAGALGGHLARRAVAGRESLYRASRAVGAAPDPDGVAAAIGEHLATPKTREIGLWSVSSRAGKDGSPTEFVLLGAWRPEGSRGEAFGARLGAGRVPEVGGLRAGSVLTLRAGDLPAPELAVWEEAGVRSVLFVALVVPGGRTAGLLSVASRAGSGPSGGATRAYMTVGAQAALALENSRLTKEARRVGREAGVMRERQRLAHEIHDTLAQGFTSVVTNARAAEAALPDDPEAARLHHGHIIRVAREGLSEARRMVRALKPEPLEDASLPEALAALVERCSDEGRVPATADVTGTHRPLSPEAEATLLRVAQEALANVRKHARANWAVLTLSYMADRVSLDVRDDGVGFEAGAAHPPGGSPGGGGFGLGAMRERMVLLGGRLVAESTPGEGTTITAELPVGANAGANGTADARAREGSDAERIVR